MTNAVEPPEISVDQRQKLKKWSEELNKLNDDHKLEEAEIWIKSVLNILNIDTDEVSE